jgi:hypothetical protein
MRQLDKLTSDPAQRYTVVTETGVTFILTLKYLPRISGWAFSIVYGDTRINDMQLVASPNLLRQWINIFPFGLAITSTDTLDPLYVDDFTTGRIKLYVLSESDVGEVEARFYS